MYKIFNLIKKYCVCKKGSGHILLSLIVFGSVMGIIYVTEKEASLFGTKSSQYMEEWEKHLLVEKAKVLASYLIQNNLILCRADGWSDKSSKCRWSADSDLSTFYLSNEVDSKNGVSFSGTYKSDGKKYNYNLSFNMVDYKDTSIKTLIGEIPEYICRKKSNLNIIKGATCPSYDSSISYINQACKKNGVKIANSWCEYISPVDSDSLMVLVKVEVPFIDPITQLKQKHRSFAGMRRPLAMLEVKSVVSGKRCARSCNIGTTAHFAPDCRADTSVPTEVGVHSGLASHIITLKNKGPGSLYKLSIIKDTESISTGERTKDITPDIITKSGKQVFMPGETLNFEYFYECPIQVNTETIYRSGSADGVLYSVRNQMVPFQNVSYSLGLNMQNPIGGCYSASGANLAPSNPARNINAVIPANRGLISKASCDNKAPSCSHGGENGTCVYSEIEPSRLFMSPHDNNNVQTSQRVITHQTVIVQAPPPPFNGHTGDGDGQGDGVEGAGN